MSVPTQSSGYTGHLPIGVYFYRRLVYILAMDETLPKKRRGRPPKVPRDDIDTRAALIQSGTEVLTEQGFAVSGIDGILKRVGVPNPNFS